MPRKLIEQEFNKKIYLAIPYSDPDPKVREARFLLSNRIAARIMDLGYVVFSPISHSHLIELQSSKVKSWEWWQKQDKAFLDWCDELWIIKLFDYWKKSTGVQGEIEEIKKQNKPIIFIPLGDLDLKFYCDIL